MFVGVDSAPTARLMVCPKGSSQGTDPDVGVESCVDLFSVMLCSLAMCCKLMRTFNVDLFSVVLCGGSLPCCAV